MAASYVHNVCTRQEARDILAKLGQDRFWVSACGCRQSRGPCARSPHEVCLGFEPSWSESDSKREITRAEVEGILRLAEEKHLVMRPFRDQSDGRMAGFCVCCDDCCYYFLHPGEEQCAQGALVERTDAVLCTDCGDCAGVCYFGARQVVDGRLAVDDARCYGCGLCLDVCPAGCIEMVQR